MLTKNLSAFAIGVRSTSVRPPAPAMSVVVRATFAIRDDGSLGVVGPADAPRPLSAATFRDDDDDCMGGAVFPSDFADFKTRAEFLLKGACHTPRTAAVAECPVQIKVGTWSKTLRVVGRRVWGGSAAPAPFVKMPLDWEHAYGGEAYAKNPSGLGFSSEELPNVLYAHDSLRARGASLEPAGFGPVNARWPQRAGKLGKDYGDTYRKTRAPYFAADMDPTFFLEAPPDQWLDTYLRGDEPISLQNLHPRVANFSTALPGLVARVFYRSEGGAFHEMPMHLDTLFFDMDAGRIELSWRAVVDVREEDLDDVKTLLVASELLGGPRHPVDHYEALAATFEADPVGLRGAVPAQSATAAADSTDPANISEELAARLGPLQPAELIELAPALDAAIAKAASTDPKVSEALTERTREAKAAALAEPSPPRVTKPGALPYIGLRRRVRESIDRGVEARDKALARGVKPDQLGQLMDVEALADDPRWPELDPSYSRPLPLSTAEPGPGADLVDRDLRGRDLRGLDLRGANLEGALLVGARLDNARLDGARLYGAVLYKAVLTSAVLRGADLSRANLAFIDARGAVFDEAVLGEAYFEDADLDDASFVRATGEYAIFTRAKLARANFQGATLPSLEIDSADLEGARFDGANVSRGRFSASRCVRADFSRADLQRCSFEGANLGEAKLFDVRGDDAIFTSANASRAIFAFARLRGCHMDRLVATAADFHGADLRDCRLHRAKLDAARLTSMNLFGVDLWKANLQGSRLTKSNLFEAKLTHAILKDCDLTGANLKRSTLERP